jgi:hypothetical protein
MDECTKKNLNQTDRRYLALRRCGAEWVEGVVLLENSMFICRIYCSFKCCSVFCLMMYLPYAHYIYRHSYIYIMCIYIYILLLYIYTVCVCSCIFIYAWGNGWVTTWCGCNGGLMAVTGVSCRSFGLCFFWHDSQIVWTYLRGAFSRCLQHLKRFGNPFAIFKGQGVSSRAMFQSS